MKDNKIKKQVEQGVVAAYEAAMAKYNQEMRHYQDEVNRQEREYRQRLSAWEEEYRAWEEMKRRTHANAEEAHRMECVAAKEEYERNCATAEENYRQDCAIVDTKRTTLKNIIASYATARDEIARKLTELYSRNIIFPEFRNIVAVYQLRRYLEMGVCDTLEGATGAYAQYLQDLRNKEIVGSITDLKFAMVQALGQLAFQQGLMLEELRTIGANIKSLDYDIMEGLSDIQSGVDGLSDTLSVLGRSISRDISDVSARISEDISASASASSANAKRIERAVSESAHQSYIVQHYDRMNNYMGASYNM